MKGIVVYYSATGNTAKIAKAIHRGMKAVIDCDIVPLKKADPAVTAQYDVIGLEAPILTSQCSPLSLSRVAKGMTCAG